jgi:hypothetical protein
LRPHAELVIPAALTGRKGWGTHGVVFNGETGNAGAPGCSK